ncbi:hypothetical protein [Mucilaginibacter dorajii]|uniref:Outer membrane protein beta-barrel domain-containing protein n=1 Tax=Mucilaginibacter dorajii TaxID=692994 RepID=A0ABP7R9H2_9SPHI|nr:hypothetical protein [Mucilaginibacter dorajii]MCS3736792.1 hypothetical protein [Mucilaginibacter dorajii]
MKKILFLIPAFLLAFQISKAQTEKGSQTLGVNLNFSYQKSDNLSINPSDNSSVNVVNKYTLFGVAPTYSYFIANKLDIGATLGYDYLHFDNGDQSYPQTRHEHDYTASIFLRKYLMYNEKFGIRTGPYLTYVRFDSKDTYPANSSINNTTSKSDSYLAGINLGLVYYPSKCLGFAANLANLSYSHVKTDSGVNGHGKTDNVNFNFISNNIGISVFYVFGAK